MHPAIRLCPASASATTTKQVVTNIVDNSMEEFEQVVKENDMQQQLADLEALALQRGRALGDSDGADARWAEGFGVWCVGV